MATQLFANNAASTLASGITNTATSLTVATGHGALFPSPTGGDWFLLTLTQPTTESSWEIVKCTGRSGDVLTIVRAQEGTTAAEWGSGVKAELRVTAGTLNGKENTGTAAAAVAAHEAAGDPHPQYQVDLVSGTNIKTINGTSLLGPGDISAAQSNIAGITGASVVSNIVQLSQANYDAITTPDPNTLYIITG